MMKQECKNDATYSFTGKEASPLGLGYCASAEQVGTMMEGRDKMKWMVGMKNGVRVWNRVPSELAEAATIPMKKEAPIARDEEAPAPKAPKKAAAPRKAKEVDEGAAPKKAARPKAIKKKPVGDEAESANGDAEAESGDVEAEVGAVTKPAAKKKAVRKKVAPESAEDGATGDDKPAPKKLSTFQLFMKHRMKTLGEERPELSHKEKFGMVSSEWKTLTAEEKEAAVKAAREFVETAA